MTFDTSTWEEISFGEIARSLTNAVKNPLSENLVRYVGLEHIEPGNIHIKSWGNVADGTTFTRVFRKGQVLFGKRRAYQKKAAVAEFDGICSGDILVLEAIEKSLSPELLPFIVQSGRFLIVRLKHQPGLCLQGQNLKTWQSLHLDCQQSLMNKSASRICCGALTTQRNGISF